jgi:hypothetical protein
VLQDTREWKIGRRGEILNIGIWAHYGFTLLDVSASANLRAPLLHEVSTDLISPDQLVMRNITFFMDTKTKEQPFPWKGGSRGATGNMPPGDAHGMDRRSFVAYQRVRKQTNKPVVIAVICIKTAELLANELTWLGEPYPSVNPDYDMVNWPSHKFRRVCEFDPRRLRKYFYHPNGTPRDGPLAMPDARTLQQVVAWLRPQQAELEWLREDLLRRLEDDWDTP